MDGDLPNVRSIQDLLALFFGCIFITQPEETDYAVGTSPVAIGANVNGMRVGAVIGNPGATTLAVSFNPNLTITTGIPILAGRHYRFDWYYDGDLLQRPLYVISSAGAGAAHVLERFLTGA